LTRNEWRTYRLRRNRVATGNFKQGETLCSPSFAATFNPKDSAFIGKSAATDILSWKSAPDHYELTALDDHGRSGSCSALCAERVTKRSAKLRGDAADSPSHFSKQLD